MDFLDLPNEMLQHIASLLPAKSLVALGETCKLLREVSLSEHLWQALCERDFKVFHVHGWNLSFKDAYSKVLTKCDFLGLKRLALMPYGGLVNICWTEGEIQVQCYSAERNKQPLDKLTCHCYFSIRWDNTKEDLNVLYHPNGRWKSDKNYEAKILWAGKYPLLRCADCGSDFAGSSRYGQSNPRFKEGFPDHPGVFRQFTLHNGCNCPLLPIPRQTSLDQERSPITLGLYTGDYGFHGTEILYFMMHETDHKILQGLKIVGDPNVPAGYTSVTVYLDKPVVLMKDEQDTTQSLINSDKERSADSFDALLNGDNAVLQHPFIIPADCNDRDANVPKICKARYLGTGRIAGNYYSNLRSSRIHFVKFSEEIFGVLWLDLNSFSIFHIVRDKFPVCIPIVDD